MQSLAKDPLQAEHFTSSGPTLLSTAADPGLVLVPLSGTLLVGPWEGKTVGSGGWE